VTATVRTSDEWGFVFRQGQYIPLFCDTFRTALWPTWSSSLVSKPGTLTQKVKRVFKVTAHHCLLSKLRIRGAVPSFPPYTCMKWCLVNHVMPLTRACFLRLPVALSVTVGFMSLELYASWMGNVTGHRAVYWYEMFYIKTQPTLSCIQSITSRGCW